MNRKRTIGTTLLILALSTALAVTGCNPSSTMTEAESEQAAKALYAGIGTSTQMDPVTRALSDRDLGGTGTITVGSETTGYVTFTFDSDLTYNSDYEQEVYLGITCELAFEEFKVSYTEDEATYEYTLDGKVLAVFSIFAIGSSGSVQLALISGDDLVIEGEGLYNLLNAELLYSVTADLTSSGFSITGGYEGTINGHTFTAADTSLTFSYNI